jgi:hypothetical protein
MHATTAELDFLEEIRLRRWARENYVAGDERDEAWHPVVLDEMRAKDLELGIEQDADLVFHNDVT